MRNRLCTALSLLVLAAPAAHAASPIRLELGGYMDEWAGTVNNQRGKDYAAAVGGGYPPFTPGGAGNAAIFHPSTFVTMNDAQIAFKGSTTLDNGMKVAVEVDAVGSQGMPSTRLYNAQNKAIKRAYATVSGTFGRFQAGQQDNIAEQVHSSAPDLTGLGGQDNDWWWFVIRPSRHDATRRTYFGDDRVDDKVIYVTPALAGLQAGFSYTPSTNRGTAGASAPPTAYDGFTPVGNGANGDLYVEALAYNNSFGNLGVKADVAAAQGNYAGKQVWQAGLNVAYAGFTVGGSYIDRGTSTRHPTPATKAAASTGHAWDAGISYAIGPYSVAANYFTEQAANDQGAGHDKDWVWAVEGAYALGPGVTVDATVFSVHYTDGARRDYEENHGWGVVGGLALNF